MPKPTSDFNSPTPERLSSLLSGYDVEAEVSSGISGTIYEARQLSLDREVTIKVLPPEIGKDAALRAAFESEAKTMARLNDPNLVDVFDFGAVDDMLYIIMERVPDRSLFAVTDGSHVDQEEGARLMAEVCRGLGHAHHEGIVHRALDPKNILIDKDARPKIVDFGLASLFANRPETTASPYAAPEINQPGRTADHRADIYSVGMILYSIVVGHLPSDPYTPPSSTRDSCPELDSIIFKAIQPDPEQRYASAHEMSKELEAMLEKLNANASPGLAKTLITAAPSTARPIARPVAIPISTSSSSNSALIISLLVVAIIAAAGLLVLKNNSEAAKIKQRQKQTQKTPPSANTTGVEPPSENPQRDKPRKKKKKREPRIVDTPPVRRDPPPSENRPRDRDIVRTPKTDPKPPQIPDKPEAPDFDREEWLEKARAFMQKKGRSALADYDRDLLKNIDKFERSVNRIIRKLDRFERKAAEAEAEKLYEKLREIGRLPTPIPEDMPWRIRDEYKEAINDQDKIDAEALRDFTRLRFTYIQGLDKQTSILRKEGNGAHADALDEEIEATQNDIGRFIRILRGLDADLEPEEEERDD